MLRALVKIYLPLSRAWAAGLAAEGDAARFSELAPWDGPLDRARASLHDLTTSKRAYQEASHAWQETLFAPHLSTPQALIQAEILRQRTAHGLMSQRGQLWRLHRIQPFQSTVFSILPPSELASQWPAIQAQAHPAMMKTSHSVTIAGQDHCWLSSPAPLGDQLWARLIIPKNPSSVMILAHGIHMEHDHWKGLPALGLPHKMPDCAWLMPEGPYHGRRRIEGYYGGEPVFALGPAGFITYCWSHALELGWLIAEARLRFQRPVALIGVSLGALVAQYIATHSSQWPAAMQPDALCLITSSASLWDVIYRNKLTQAIHLPSALAQAGWTEQDLSPWLQLFEPGPCLSLDPKRIVIQIGRADQITPCSSMLSLIQRWKIPQDHIFLHHGGHFTTSIATLIQPSCLARLHQIVLRC